MVINVPESEGAVPLGHGLPEPGDSALSPGNGGELGKCAGVRPGWAVHPATRGASGEARGQRAGSRVRASQQRNGASTYPTYALTSVVLSMPAFSSLLPRPFSY